MSDFPLPRPPSVYAPSTTTSYPDAAVRGQVRLWKRELAKHYGRFEIGYRHSLGRNETLAGFVYPDGLAGTERRRHRAFKKLNLGFGPGAVLEGLRISGSAPLAVWSILKPRDSVREADDRNCVTVNYIIAGVMPAIPGGGVGEGMWSLEVFDHALGRVLERMGMATPLGPVIAEAHHNVLQLNYTRVLPGNDLNHTPEFLVRAGSGGFICKVATGSDISVGGEFMFYLQAVTWIADDMLHNDQAMLVADGQPGERLVDGWLMPRPLRRIERRGNRLHCSSWVTGLPDLLAAPKGRA